ncbi:PH domain-containing protein [Fructobacillus tropaeoli]|uniref:PH domain-containing protein n=1 Tax=Fructobacillus tropaeoli TaxID=709323 RepID=UPI0009FE22F4
MKTYELTDSELIYRSGVLERQVRHLPYHKIQNIDRKQWFFLQPFHLEEIAVDSGGEGSQAKSDFTLRCTNLGGACS